MSSELMALWQFVSVPDNQTLSKKDLRLLDLLKVHPGDKVDFYELVRDSNYTRKGVKNALYDLQKLGAVKCYPIFKNTSGVKKTDYLLELPSVKNWLSNIKKGDHTRTSLYILARFDSFCKAHSEFKNPEEMINDALNGTIKNLQKHLNLAKEYSFSIPGILDTSRQKHYDRIRSFYLHNQCELPESPLKFNTPEVSMELETFDFQNFLDMARKAMKSRRMNKLWTAITLNTIQSGMDDSTFVAIFNHFAFPQIVKHFGTDDFSSWDSNKVPIKLSVQRQKTQVKHYTFIDHDGVSTLVDWLLERKQKFHSDVKIYPSNNKKYLDRSDPIFVTHGLEYPIKPSFVSLVYRESGKDVGVNIPPEEMPGAYRGATIRYPYHSHEVRDNLRSLAHSVKRDVEAEFFIGHPIDQYKYDKSPWSDPSWYIEAYKLISPSLNILSVDPEKAKLVKQIEDKDHQLTESNRNLKADLFIEQEERKREREENNARFARLEKLFTAKEIEDALERAKE